MVDYFDDNRFECDGNRFWWAGLKKWYITIELILMKELVFLEVIAVKNEYFVTIVILVMGLNFKNLFVIVAMIFWCSILILGILLLNCCNSSVGKFCGW